jgi:hypothetical protein
VPTIPPASAVSEGEPTLTTVRRFPAARLRAGSMPLVLARMAAEGWVGRWAPFWGVRTGFGGRRCRTIVRGAACPGETLVAPGPTSLALEASGRRPGDWITGRRPCRPIKLGLLSAAVIAYRHEPVRTT